MQEIHIIIISSLGSFVLGIVLTSIRTYFTERSRQKAIAEEIGKITEIAGQMNAKINMISHANKSLWEEQREALLKFYLTMYNVTDFMRGLAMNVINEHEKSISEWGFEINKMSQEAGSSMAMLNFFLEQGEIRTLAENYLKDVTDMLVFCMAEVSKIKKDPTPSNCILLSQNLLEGVQKLIREKINDTQSKFADAARIYIFENKSEG